MERGEAASQTQSGIAASKPRHCCNASSYGTRMGCRRTRGEGRRSVTTRRAQSPRPGDGARARGRQSAPAPTASVTTRRAPACGGRQWRRRVLAKSSWPAPAPVRPAFLASGRLFGASGRARPAPASHADAMMAPASRMRWLPRVSAADAAAVQAPQRVRAAAPPRAVGGGGSTQTPQRANVRGGVSRCGPAAGRPNGRPARRRPFQSALSLANRHTQFARREPMSRRSTSRRSGSHPPRVGGGGGACRPL